jgi:hypothetical protein
MVSLSTGLALHMKPLRECNNAKPTHHPPSNNITITETVLRTILFSTSNTAFRNLEPTHRNALQEFIAIGILRVLAAATLSVALNANATRFPFTTSNTAFRNLEATHRGALEEAIVRVFAAAALV